MTTPNVTQLLEAMDAGDGSAEERLFAAVYDELHSLASAKMRQESPGHTLQATALVHEAYLRLGGNNNWQWNSRAHFFWAAGEAMRRILIERARRQQAAKRGGPDQQRVSLSLCPPEESDQAIDLLALDEALSSLEEKDTRKAQVVKLRFFAGLTLEETASALDVTRRIVDEDWRMAKAWLKRELSRGEHRDSGSDEREPS